MLDQGQDAVRHEAGGAHGGTATGHLGDLDDPSTGVDLDSPSGACCHDLVRADLTARIDDDLHPVAAHMFTVASVTGLDPRVREATSARGRRRPSVRIRAWLGTSFVKT